MAAAIILPIAVIMTRTLVCLLMVNIVDMIANDTLICTKDIVTPLQATNLPSYGILLFYYLICCFYKGFSYLYCY